MHAVTQTAIALMRSYRIASCHTLGFPILIIFIDFANDMTIFVITYCGSIRIVIV